MASPKPPPPKVILFDIGGVVVVSPFQAILDYEVAHGIPRGYINHTISRTGPNGAWQRVERGEIPLDDSFFALWGRELNDQAAWDWYLDAQARKKQASSSSSTAAADAAKGEPRPRIDAKQLFFNMMRNSRRPDPAMWAALHRLRQASGGGGGGAPGFVVAALSNNVNYPPDCRDERGEPFEPGLRFDADDPFTRALRGEELRRKRDVRNMFDVFVGSATAGLRKPDQRAYEHTLREVEAWMRASGRLAGGEALQMADVVFLDDIGQNLRSARQLGMRTIKVTLGKNRDAVAELEKVTGLPLLDDSAKL